MEYDDLKYKNIELDDCIISIMNISFSNKQSEHVGEDWHERDITTMEKSMFDGVDSMFLK